MLTDDEKTYYQLAKEIAEGKHTLYAVFEAFSKHPDLSAKIVDFWMRCDEFTQAVVHYLAVEKARLHMEVAYGKEVDKWTLRKHNLRIMLNGLKQIYYGVWECLTGADLIPKNTGTDRKD